MRFFALIAAIALAGIDQLIKYFVIVYLKPVHDIPIINGVFHLTYGENTGAAFNSFDKNYFILIGLTSLIVFIGVIYIGWAKKANNILLFTVAAIIGGGLGNLIDRVFREYVIDYINFEFINFAIFNFADMCVVCGSIFLVIYILYDEYKQNKLKKLQNITIVEGADSKNEEIE